MLPNSLPPSSGAVFLTHLPPMAMVPFATTLVFCVKSNLGGRVVGSTIGVGLLPPRLISLRQRAVETIREEGSTRTQFEFEGESEGLDPLLLSSRSQYGIFDLPRPLEESRS